LSYRLLEERVYLSYGERRGCGKIFKWFQLEVFMAYDVFIDDEIVAGILESKLDKASMVDTTERPDVYQILDLNIEQLKSIRGVVEKFPENLEVRDASNGDYLFRNGAWVGDPR